MLLRDKQLTEFWRQFFPIKPTLEDPEMDVHQFESAAILARRKFNRDLRNTTQVFFWHPRT
ncbi:hypothetical protein CRM94_17215 [Burkholderia gladioli]|uniref:Uncharacterized protein n=1 Tax=Burkholderia gladioli TaxID=28095 RepID=A0A2A7S9T0_BURGA|nr:hypothetical protein CRM94_17215 [Burkholderia gladioli]